MPDKRLIDANALDKALVQEYIMYNDVNTVLTLNGVQVFNAAIDTARSKIGEAATIDAVEVVRCKDCKYAIVNENHIEKPLSCCLTKMVGTTDEDWFCADGKRRMDGGAEC